MNENKNIITPDELPAETLENLTGNKGDENNE